MGPTLPFSEAVHAEKYRGKGESFKEAMNRVAGALEDNDPHFRAFREILLDMRFMPGGRVQSSIGSTRRVTAYNCFVSGVIEDSFVDGHHSIMDIATEAAATMRMGGGIGYDFSTLRPRGATIAKLASSSSGPISFMEIYDAICRCVSSSGHRRGAQMAAFRIDHPDIEEFVRCKQPPKEVQPMMEELAKYEPNSPIWHQWYAILQKMYRLTGFNISVLVTDEFMNCLQEDKPFALRFGGQKYREVDPQSLWDLIMRSTWDWAEPGVIFIDTINRMNNLAYCEKIIATNPCVAGDTPILTDDGWHQIQDLVGQQVKVWNGEQWSEVSPCPTGMDQPMVEVELNNGQRLRCTTAHGFCLADGSRKEAACLLPGDDLLEMTWPVVDAGIDDESAYTQGCFAGDGWYASNDRPYISFKREDKKLLREWIAYRNAYETQAGYLFLYIKGCIHQPKDFVPVNGWSVKSRLDWLAGLLDTDGTAIWSHDADGEKSSCSLAISSVNREFVDNIALLLRTLGVPSARDVDARQNEWSASEACYRISVKSSMVKKLVDLGLLCHRVDVSRNNPRSTNRTKLTVRTVKSAGAEKVVYCFTEPLAHRGCFNGVLTAQCGEQPLPAYGACLLGSFNLVKYIKRGMDAVRIVGQQYEGQYYFDWDQLKADIPHVVRAMDNVVDKSTYPLYEQEKEAKAKRRMGLGVTGLANALEAMGLPYGSDAFVCFTGQVLEFIANECYRASALLAQEKGAFPLYDKRYLSSQFLNAVISEEVRELIAKYGIRNSHLTSIAPTGTISICADNVSSGIEPVFSYRQRRKVNMPGGMIETDFDDYGYHTFGTRGRRSTEVSIGEHLNVLAAAARNVDSAVSKTCNVPADMSWSDFKQAYVTAWELGCKGLTTYQVGGKRVGIVQSVDNDYKACKIDFTTGRKECE